MLTLLTEQHIIGSAKRWCKKMRYDLESVVRRVCRLYRSSEYPEDIGIMENLRVSENDFAILETVCEPVYVDGIKAEDFSLDYGVMKEQVELQAEYVRLQRQIDVLLKHVILSDGKLRVVGELTAEELGLLDNILLPF